MTKVLVTAASKHGATDEIARVIAETLENAKLEVTVLPPDKVPSVEPYDAVVIGSAVYVGRWLDPATRLVARNREMLATRPVWLFSSGPIGDPPKPDGDPGEIATIRERTLARDHRVFAGRVEKADLGLAEKAIMAAVRAPEGDYRPWDEIKAWAAGIARALQPTAVRIPTAVVSGKASGPRS